MNKDETLDIVRLLSRNLQSPVWLAGGLAADFHVGRWTREHDDIDLVAFEEDREALAEEFNALLIRQTEDHGWITRWTRLDRTPGEISLAFFARANSTTGNLIIHPHMAGRNLVAGVFPGVPGNLDPHRYRSLEDVRFRVVSAEDEWVFAKGFNSLRPNADPRATVEHNLALLETVLSDTDRERLTLFIGRRIPLDTSSG